jgi:hypothetical protein
MEHSESRLTRNASAMALFPILGMMGGILFGAFRVWIFSLDGLVGLRIVVQGGFVGSVLGAVVAVGFAALERRSLTSLQKLMGLIVVVAVLLWAVMTLLRDLAANGTL